MQIFDRQLRVIDFLPQPFDFLIQPLGKICFEIRETIYGKVLLLLVALISRRGDGNRDREDCEINGVPRN
jgi:hypothetical protein